MSSALPSSSAGDAPRSSSVPWNTSGNASGSGLRSGGERRNGIPRTLEQCRETFIGYQVYAMDDASDNASFVGEKRNSDGNPDTKRRPTPIGIVDDVMSAGDAADGALDDGSGEYFLLKVVKPHLQDEASPDARDTREEESEGEEGVERGDEEGHGLRDSEPHIEEQHLIPLVPSIVPVIDAEKELIVLSPPQGLLDLGRRQAALARIDRLLRKSGIVSSVYMESPDGLQEELKPRMPTRRELEEMGRYDIVKLVLDNGGFLDVAQCLGYRGRRKPPGYWEDEEVLDRELSLFVGRGWIKMEALDSDEESTSDDDAVADGGEDDGRGEDDAPSTAAIATPSVTPSMTPSTTSPTTTEQTHTAATTHNSYWFNTVTRQLRWTQPQLPQIIPLDDMGIDAIIIETEEDRAMPSRSSLLAAGRYDLHTAIVSQGGYVEVSNALDRWPAWPPTRKLRNLKTLKSEINTFIREHHLDKRFLPAASDFLDLGRPDIHQVIVARFGGYKEVGRRIGLRSHRGGGVDWRDFESVCAEMKAFCSEQGLSHLPTHEALRKTGRHDLRHALQKWGSARVSEAIGVDLRNGRGGWKKKKMTNADDA